MPAIRARVPSDDAWVQAVLTERWGSPFAACLSGLHDATMLPGVVAELGGQPAGLLTYRIDGDGCEVVTLDSLSPGHGIGTALLQAAADLARSRGCRRLWLTTTNDNLPALRFYQRRGLDLVRLHHGAVHEWRRTVKPQMSERGQDGILLAHALELELRLTDDP
jgi:GNAT superfamily N-acetyltransferase